MVGCCLIPLTRGIEKNCNFQNLSKGGYYNPPGINIIIVEHPAPFLLV